jgi:hypothetical protein
VCRIFDVAASAPAVSAIVFLPHRLPRLLVAVLRPAIVVMLRAHRAANPSPADLLGPM